MSICLQKLLNIENKYCKDRFEMHNKFFIIYNYIDIISHMNNSNSNNNPNKSIKTFDFKTLYTTIPHNKLKEAMELFVRDVFGYNKNIYIDVHNKSAKMVNKQGNGFSFSIVELINTTNTVIENSYI